MESHLAGNGGGGPVNRLMWWVIGTLTSIVLAGGGAWVGQNSSRIAELSTDNAMNKVEIRELQQGQIKTEQGIERINDKLDKVMDRLLPKRP